MDGYSQPNENLKTAISLTMQELSPLIKACENRMPVENLMTYANEIGKLLTALVSLPLLYFSSYYGHVRFHL